MRRGIACVLPKNGRLHHDIYARICGTEAPRPVNPFAQISTAPQKSPRTLASREVPACLECQPKADPATKGWEAQIYWKGITSIICLVLEGKIALYFCS